MEIEEVIERIRKGKLPALRNMSKEEIIRGHC